MSGLYTGCKVQIKDGDSEIFTVREWMGSESKCWISDKNGRGWFIYPSQLIIVEDEETDEDES